VGEKIETCSDGFCMPGDFITLIRVIIPPPRIVPQLLGRNPRGDKRGGEGYNGGSNFFCIGKDNKIFFADFATKKNCFPGIQ